MNPLPKILEPLLRTPGSSVQDFWFLCWGFWILRWRLLNPLLRILGTLLKRRLLNPLLRRLLNPDREAKCHWHLLIIVFHCIIAGCSGRRGPRGRGGQAAGRWGAWRERGGGGGPSGCMGDGGERRSGCWGGVVWVITHLALSTIESDPAVFPQCCHATLSWLVLLRFSQGACICSSYFHLPVSFCSLFSFYLNYFSSLSRCLYSISIFPCLQMIESQYVLRGSLHISVSLKIYLYSLYLSVLFSTLFLCISISLYIHFYVSRSFLLLYLVGFPRGQARNTHHGAQCGDTPSFGMIPIKKIPMYYWYQSTIDRT